MGYRYTTIQLEVSGKKRYGWSKYGGARDGLVKQTIDVWYCQVCGEENTKGMPTFMLEIHPNEFIRICSKCQSLIEDDDTFDTLRERVYKKYRQPK
jgi:hypothetical protein